MKSKKIMKRYCNKCKKHTEHKVTQAKQSTRSSAHPLSRGSTKRLRRRGERRGSGNLNRYSKPTKPKTFEAKALGRLGGLKGGKARAATLTRTRRTEIARKAAQARWGK